LFAEGLSLDAHLTTVEADLLRRAFPRSDGERSEAEAEAAEVYAT
jgi:hypothetical protein